MQHYPCNWVSYEPRQRSSVTSCIMEAYVSVCSLGRVPLQRSLGSFLLLLFFLRCLGSLSCHPTEMISILDLKGKQKEEGRE